ncbi:c-type cytochrome [Ramlibacter algicola]|uniref:C-type cytochrome n=1 Tax=Ramlibacter algicola TaxID=2795217 RepID=A0A934UTF1_9BURK|nr:c-type cytochrome [Ramlibacter algicola]MBK0394703.1 c-type cytochrome [Ramlibacter algicola]
MPTPTAPFHVRLAPWLAALVATLALWSCGGSDDPAAPLDPKLLAEGRQVFRFDTFGDEAQWTDTLRLHEVIETAVSPATALAVGLKVDVEALPQAVQDALKAGQVDLGSPATTLALLKLDAVVGVKGEVETVNGVDRLRKVGITCALCHSTVDDSFAKGIGRRLDGWPNRDLDPGAIISLSPVLDAKAKAVYQSWGKGKYDPRFNLDGLSKPVVIPPAFGLAGVGKITLTGDGDDIAYWNRYVAVTQMGGQGTFDEPRLNLHVVHGSTDLVSAKLPALQAYQLSLAAPAPPPGSFDTAAAARGQALFMGKAQCATCHAGSAFTDANAMLHPPSASMVEPENPSYAARSATKMYRTAPLPGAWSHAPYFHDGSAATLEDVVSTYNQRQQLQLSPDEVRDVAQYLRSL